MDKRRLPRPDLRETPSKEDILAGCKEVQANWDAATERMRRTGRSALEEITTPIINVAEIVG